MSLQHLTAREWRRRPGRALLTILSVAIAVTAVLGTSLAQTTVRQAYRQVSLTLEGPPALEIVAAAGGRFASDSVPELAAISGVKAIAPLICRATAARLEGRRLRTLLIGLDATPESAAWQQVELTSGAVCREPNELIISADVARDLKAELGTRVVFLTRRGPRAANVVGIANPQSLHNLAQGATLIMPAATVQDWYGTGNEVDRVRVVLDEAANRDAAQQQIAKLLPTTLTVQKPPEQAQLADEMLRSTELALQFAGALSLAMATFIILNTLRMNFSERRRQLAIMRAIGATQSQIIRLLVTEGLWIGVIGSIVGIPGGIGLAYVLSQAMQELVDTNLPFSMPRWDTLLLALTTGPLVSVIAAWLPARQSRDISPAEGMRDDEARRADHFPRWALIITLLAWGIAVTLLALVVQEKIAPEAAIPAGLLMLIAFIGLIPVVSGPLLRLADRCCFRLWGIEGHLAAEQLIRRPTRTGLTAGVIVVAISNGLGLGNAILTNVEDVRNWYRRSMSGDYFLINPTANDLTVSDDGAAGSELQQELSQLAGVERVISMRFPTARAMDQSAVCIVRDFPSDAALPWAIAPAEVGALRQKLAQGELVLSSVLARKLKLSVGDNLRAEVRGRTLSRPIAAIVTDYRLGGMGFFIDVTAAREWFDPGPVNVYMVERRPEVDQEEVGRALRSFAEQRGLVYQSFVSMKQNLDQLIDGIVVSLWGLLAVGFVVGAFAVANTLTMSVLEQTRELGLLRVVGMTRWQVRKMVLLEAGLLGLLGFVLGTLAGVTTAFVIHACNEPLLGHSLPFVFHASLLALNAGGCLAIVAISGWSPSYRAANLPLLQVLSYE
ncbi:MAG TPA: FtsX-like permease family protein, partial [Pirellulaceae bacterium]|nr:FtsX-like permease family protein [Pirellulaceae bacterium]